MTEETNSQMLKRLEKEHERLERNRLRLEFKLDRLRKKIRNDYSGPPSSSPPSTI